MKKFNYFFVKMSQKAYQRFFPWNRLKKLVEYEEIQIFFVKTSRKDCFAVWRNSNFPWKSNRRNAQKTFYRQIPSLRCRKNAEVPSLTQGQLTNEIRNICKLEVANIFWIKWNHFISHFSDNESDEKKNNRLANSAAYKSNSRANETQSEYDRRLKYQDEYRAKDNKSKLRRHKNLTYLSNWHKLNLAKETFQAKNQRRKDKIDHRNWKDQYTRWVIWLNF